MDPSHPMDPVWWAIITIRRSENCRTTPPSRTRRGDGPLPFSATAKVTDSSSLWCLESRWLELPSCSEETSGVFSVTTAMVKEVCCGNGTMSSSRAQQTTHNTLEWSVMSSSGTTRFLVVDSSEVGRWFGVPFLYKVRFSGSRNPVLEGLKWHQWAKTQIRNLYSYWLIVDKKGETNT
jgi:hypothetical protein